MRPVVILLAAYLVCPVAVGAGASSSINLSRDLVSLGIAGQNLSHNDPSLDARPLFEAALKYIRAHRVRTLTLDRGAYYFLTAQSSTA